MIDILQHILFLDNDQLFRKPVMVKLESENITQEIEVHLKLNEKIEKRIIEEAKRELRLKKAIIENKKAKIKTNWRCLYYNRGILKHGIVSVMHDPSDSVNKLKIVIINSSSNSINKEVEAHCYYMLKELT